MKFIIVGIIVSFSVFIYGPSVVEADALLDKHHHIYFPASNCVELCEGLRPNLDFNNCPWLNTELVVLKDLEFIVNHAALDKSEHEQACKIIAQMWDLLSVAASNKCNVDTDRGTMCTAEILKIIILKCQL